MTQNFVKLPSGNRTELSDDGICVVTEMGMRRIHFATTSPWVFDPSQIVSRDTDRSDIRRDIGSHKFGMPHGSPPGACRTPNNDLPTQPVANTMVRRVVS